MEPEVWQHIASGDRGAYAEVYTYYYKRLFNYGRKYTEEEALIEDAIQEVFIILWKNRKKFSDIQSPGSYLFFSFRNHLFLLLKQQKRRAGEEKNFRAEPEFNVEHIMIRSEMDEQKRQRLQQALDGLPSRQREALFLRFYEGIPYEKIAEVMQISVPSAYKTIYKALTYLRSNTGLSLSLLIFLLGFKN